MVIDDGVHRTHPGGRVLTEDRRLYVDQREAVEFVELLRSHCAHVDAEGLDHGAMFSGRLTSPKEIRGAGWPLSTQQNTQRIAALRCRRGPGRAAAGCRVRSRGSNEGAQRDDPFEVPQVRELLVDVIADQRPKAGAKQAWM